MIKLTEKHLKEFFPKDMRFLYYVANRYGYSFHDEEVVRKANFHAEVAMTKLYNKGIEFDNNEHMYGMVMSTFRYSILNAYNKNANEQNMDTRTESELIYGSGDDEYNIYLNNAVSLDEEYDDTAENVYSILFNRLSPLAKEILYLKYKKSFKDVEVRRKLDMDSVPYRRILRSIQREYKKINNRINDTANYTQKTPKKYPTVFNSKTRIDLLRDVRSESPATNKATADSHTKAMSWIYSDK